MFGAINGTRGAIEAAVEPDAVYASEAATASGAHVPYLAADGSFAAFEPS